SSSPTYNPVTVGWNPVDTASGYGVVYNNSNDANYTALPKTTATTITIQGLTPETTYKLRVYAVGDDASYSDSVYSAIKAVKTKAATIDATPLTAPAFKSSSSTYNSVTVMWSAVANASGYVVEYKSSNDANYTALPRTTATAVSIPNLAPDTTYKLRVYAVGDGANYSDSAYSAVKAVKTKVAASAVLDEAFAEFFDEGFFEEI
ncbi:MAG: fibronectin type III domain-containing protein, partial [Thermoguttaceae bacterium]|nr:fibronectin type III domain-containing protein [Thermoguttaceae bacterium]